MEYRVRFYTDARTGHSPVFEYIKGLPKKERAKIEKYIEFLREHEGVLDEPLSKHIKGKIRELRVGFASQHHRILYFTFVGQTIILLHAFLKKTAKIPQNEIERAEERYINVINNRRMYEN
jgi:phage-related protein